MTDKHILLKKSMLVCVKMIINAETLPQVLKLQSKGQIQPVECFLYGYFTSKGTQEEGEEWGAKVEEEEEIKEEIEGGREIRGGRGGGNSYFLAPGTVYLLTHDYTKEGKVSKVKDIHDIML